MGSKRHVTRLKQGVSDWNAWREKNPGTSVDLSEEDLRERDLNLRGADLHKVSFFRTYLEKIDLCDANLSEAILEWAHLSGANLIEATLRGADLQGANLREANLHKANLQGAKLHQANLGGANLSEATLSEANLCQANLYKAVLPEADLRSASLVRVNFANADLTGCRVYGVSAWGLKRDGATEKNLIITDEGEPEITVDNIEVAQFIYLLLHNEKIRDVIDTIGKTAVLILGRFTPERKAVLDALREELRRRGYLPILFDFDKPASRSITETISLLARMARFVLADITDARSIPQELIVIVPDLPSVPVQPLLLAGTGEYGMFEHFTRYPWVLPLHRYKTQDQLITELGEQVIEPVERRIAEVQAGTKQVP